jgi:hypothetical protein
MLRDFDIFEKFHDGSTIWRVCVIGQHEAQRKLQELGEHSENRFYAIDILGGKPQPVDLTGDSSLDPTNNAVKRVA